MSLQITYGNFRMQLICIYIYVYTHIYIYIHISCIYIIYIYTYIYGISRVLNTYTFISTIIL